MRDHCKITFVIEDEAEGSSVRPQRITMERMLQSELLDAKSNMMWFLVLQVSVTAGSMWAGLDVFIQARD
jgi:hypothetical protein